jgi:hypothetical protein
MATNKPKALYGRHNTPHSQIKKRIIKLHHTPAHSSQLSRSHFHAVPTASRWLGDCFGEWVSLGGYPLIEQDLELPPREVITFLVIQQTIQFNIPYSSQFIFPTFNITVVSQRLV